MRKILTVLSVGIVAMSAFSCTSKLENELAELKEKINSKFELVIENPNIIPCATIEGEQTHKFKLPYTLKNATGKTIVTAICKSHYGDNIKAGIIPADEKSGFVNISVRPYEDYFEEGDGYFCSYSSASIYVTAVDEIGKTSVQVIRIPREYFCVNVDQSYDGEPAVIASATENNATFSISWEIHGSEKYFPSLGSFKFNYPFEVNDDASGDLNTVFVISLKTRKGNWSNISYTSKSKQSGRNYNGESIENLTSEKFLVWSMNTEINVHFDKNTTGSERVCYLRLMKRVTYNIYVDLCKVFIVQEP